MLQESFGTSLRRRREAQGIELNTIAEQTKIKQSLLEQLERDDLSHWPTGIFRRSFVRAYAHAIGLDPDTIVREFLACHPEEVAHETAEATADTVSSHSAPPSRLRSALSTAFAFGRRLQKGAPSEPPTMAPPIFTPPPAPAPMPAEPHPGAEASSPELLAVAEVCTEFGRAANPSDVQPLLQKAARLLDARGLIVWLWDARAAELKPALTHGYSDKVLAKISSVAADANNPTAAAFRSGKTCAITGGDQASGALVVPLLTAAGCAGVLALELQHGSEQITWVRVAATIFAALLAQVVGHTPAAEASAELPVGVPD